MIAFINQYINYIRWAVILGGLAAAFWAGLHWANLSCDAGKLKDAQARQEHQTQTIEKVRYVQIKNASLPVGAAANELLKAWNRDE